MEQRAVGRPANHTCAEGCCYRQKLSLSNVVFEVKPAKNVSLSQLQDVLENVVQQASTAVFQQLPSETEENKVETGKPKEITYPETGDMN